MGFHTPFFVVREDAARIRVIIRCLECDQRISDREGDDVRDVQRDDEGQVRVKLTPIDATAWRHHLIREWEKPQQ